MLTKCGTIYKQSKIVKFNKVSYCFAHMLEKITVTVNSTIIKLNRYSYFGF